MTKEGKVGVTSWMRAALNSRRTIIERRLSELTTAVSALSTEDAEREARGWLSSATDVIISDEPIDSPTRSMLSPSINRFLRQFPRVDVGELSIGGALVALVPELPGWVVLGRDSGEAVLAMEQGAEAVWVTENLEAPTTDPQDVYPSLFHYLLIVRTTSIPEWWNAESLSEDISA